MRITGTYISYYHFCYRRLWLFAHDIKMEQNSDLVAEGKLIDENSYPQRPKKFKQIELEGIKIDFYDAKNKVINETKRSHSNIECDIAQVKYYIYVLERNGIDGVHGLLEYPKLRQTEEVWLSEQDRQQIPEWERGVEQIITASVCPPRIEKPVCKKCAYYDFCYTDE